MTAAERQAARQKRLRGNSASKELALYRAAIREIDAFVNAVSPDAISRLELGQNAPAYAESILARVIRHLDYHLIAIGHERPEMLGARYSQAIFPGEQDALAGAYPRHSPLIYKRKP
ncbi:hypothetical protein [Endobacterium cereale]|uniref:hypothetical protein n=1 Tax=Endobacterium cereale TaxID=2663029 RepID=UPI002B4626B9|nr:hypothetical protein [Endobacterium cereale]MEB2846820.1 hypothetical protein [Endobacterium cereale]